MVLEKGYWQDSLSLYAPLEVQSEVREPGGVVQCASNFCLKGFYVRSRCDRIGLQINLNTFQSLEWGYNFEETIEIC